MKTSCEKCVFAKWEGIQTGCYFNRLDKFEKERTGDFYTVEGLCNRCFQSELPIEEAAKLAIEKTKLRADLIGSPKNLDELNTLLSVYKRYDSPKVIILDKYDKSKEFLPVLKNLDRPWNLIQGYGRIPSLDEAVDKAESSYFLILDYYRPIQDPQVDLITIADKTLNEDLTEFFCLYGEMGVLINSMYYRYFVNQSDNIVSKFLDVDTKYELTFGKMVYEWNEL